MIYIPSEETQTELDNAILLAIEIGKHIADDNTAMRFSIALRNEIDGIDMRGWRYSGQEKFMLRNAMFSGYRRTHSITRLTLPPLGPDYKLVYRRENKPGSKAVITPAMIAAEKKPTRKAALMEIKYGHLESYRAWDIIHDRVPYYAVDFFFDRVERMSRYFTA